MRRHYCLHCTKPADHVCACCRHARYCSPKCHSADWNIHRHERGQILPEGFKFGGTEGDVQIEQTPVLAQEKVIAQKPAYFIEEKAGELFTEFQDLANTIHVTLQNFRPATSIARKVARMTSEQREKAKSELSGLYPAYQSQRLEDQRKYIQETQQALDIVNESMLPFKNVVDNYPLHVGQIPVEKVATLFRMMNILQMKRFLSLIVSDPARTHEAFDYEKRVTAMREQMIHDLIFGDLITHQAVMTKVKEMREEAALEANTLLLWEQCCQIANRLYIHQMKAEEMTVDANLPFDVKETQAQIKRREEREQRQQKEREERDRERQQARERVERAEARRKAEERGEKEPTRMEPTILDEQMKIMRPHLTSLVKEKVEKGELTEEDGKKEIKNRTGTVAQLGGWVRRLFRCFYQEEETTRDEAQEIVDTAVVTLDAPGFSYAKWIAIMVSVVMFIGMIIMLFLPNDFLFPSAWNIAEQQQEANRVVGTIYNADSVLINAKNAYLNGNTTLYNQLLDPYNTSNLTFNDTLSPNFYYNATMGGNTAILQYSMTSLFNNITYMINEVKLQGETIGVAQAGVDAIFEQIKLIESAISVQNWPLVEEYAYKLNRGLQFWLDLATKSLGAGETARRHYEEIITLLQAVRNNIAIFAASGLTNVTDALTGVVANLTRGQEAKAVIDAAVDGAPIVHTMMTATGNLFGSVAPFLNDRLCNVMWSTFGNIGASTSYFAAVSEMKVRNYIGGALALVGNDPNFALAMAHTLFHNIHVGFDTVVYIMSAIVAVGAPFNLVEGLIIALERGGIHRALKHDPIMQRKARTIMSKRPDYKALITTPEALTSFLEKSIEPSEYALAIEELVQYAIENPSSWTLKTLNRYRSTKGYFPFLRQFYNATSAALMWVRVAQFVTVYLPAQTFAINATSMVMVSESIFSNTTETFGASLGLLAEHAGYVASFFAAGSIGGTLLWMRPNAFDLITNAMAKLISIMGVTFDTLIYNGGLIIATGFMAYNMATILRLGKWADLPRAFFDPATWTEAGRGVVVPRIPDNFFRAIRDIRGLRERWEGNPETLRQIYSLVSNNAVFNCFVTNFTNYVQLLPGVQLDPAVQVSVVNGIRLLSGEVEAMVV